ncbi:MAG: hypothetical protein IIZ39_15185, partial [Blautia sp.]|nr:hypothetical protein [Blautia sp.]
MILHLPLSVLLALILFECYHFWVDPLYHRNFIFQEDRQGREENPAKGYDDRHTQTNEQTNE